MLDIINQLLQGSLLCVKQLNFSRLSNTQLNSATDDALYEHAQLHADHYNRDMPPWSPSQLHAFRACFKTEFEMKHL